jgi:hypothetical protein
MTILPKGELQGETTKSVMLSAVSKKNAYIFDYTACPPNQPEVRCRPVVLTFRIASTNPLYSDSLQSNLFACRWRPRDRDGSDSGGSLRRDEALV